MPSFGPLLEDRLSPITTNLGFLHAPLAEVAQAWDGWKGRLLREKSMTVNRESVCGTLESVLLLLPPLSMPEAERYLFISCANGWTAFFDNHTIGTDLGATLPVLTGRLGCRGVRVCERGRFDGKGNRRSSAVMLEVFEATGQWHGESVRSLSLLHEGSWRWHNAGSPFSFERVEAYESKRIADRFTAEMLASYAHELGVSAFQAEFYQTAESLLISVGDIPSPRQKRVLLADAQRTS